MIPKPAQDEDAVEMPVNTEPDVEGECNARWATNRCNLPPGHPFDHGYDMGFGLVLAPWPNKKRNT